MNLCEHPEYARYEQALATYARSQQAVEAWRSSGERFRAAAGLPDWTPAGALRFVRELSRMFSAYNRVLWDDFPYCRRCYGQCCVLDATRISAFDCTALVLLGHAFPTRPERIAVTAERCIYLQGPRCAWPDEWRPIKCWLFYCALGDPTAPLAAALGRVIDERLPPPLRHYERTSGDPVERRVGDPVALAEWFDAALRAVFTAPFEARFAPSPSEACAPVGAGAAARDWAPAVQEAARRFILRAAERLADESVAERLGPLADQLLADLGVLGEALDAGPDGARDLLGDLQRRYDGPCPDTVGREAELLEGLRGQVASLLSAC